MSKEERALAHFQENLEHRLQTLAKTLAGHTQYVQEFTAAHSVSGGKRLTNQLLDLQGRIVAINEGFKGPQKRTHLQTQKGFESASSALFTLDTTGKVTLPEALSEDD